MATIRVVHDRGGLDNFHLQTDLAERLLGQLRLPDTAPSGCRIPTSIAGGLWGAVVIHLPFFADGCKLQRESFQDERMGEAKQRKQSDKWYGAVPKKGMGLVISNPMTIQGDSVTLSSDLDPNQLRFSLLFWDRLIWPTNNFIHCESGVEASFLENCGILSRPRFELYGTWSGSGAVTAVQVNAFQQLSKAEPGLWALAEGEGSYLNLNSTEFTANRGTSLELLKAIPVPDKDVGLEDLLHFKQSRRDELIALRMEIENLSASIERFGDNEHEIRKAYLAIECACIDVVKVARERKFPLRLVDLRTSYSIDFTKLIGSALAATGMTAFGLPTLASRLTGAGAALTSGALSLKMTGDLGLKGNRLKDNPYRYVSSFTTELFNL